MKDKLVKKDKGSDQIIEIGKHLLKIFSKFTNFPMFKVAWNKKGKLFSDKETSFEESDYFYTFKENTKIKKKYPINFLNDEIFDKIQEQNNLYADSDKTKILTYLKMDYSVNFTIQRSQYLDMSP